MSPHVYQSFIELNLVRPWSEVSIARSAYRDQFVAHRAYDAQLFTNESDTGNRMSVLVIHISPRWLLFVPLEQW